MSEFVGIPQLGYKEAEQNQAGKLGDEYQLIDAVFDADTDMYVNQNNRRVVARWVKNNGATALNPGAVVMRDTAGDMAFDVKAITSAATPGCGIVDPSLTGTVAQDEKFLMIVKGITDVKTTGAVAKGASLGVAASGNVTTNAKSTVGDLLHLFGVLIEDGSGGAGLYRADVDFRAVS